MIHKNGGGGSKRNVKFCFAFSFNICCQESCFHQTKSMTDFIIPYEAKLVTRNPEAVLLLLLRLLAILSLRSIQTRKEILQLLALYFQLLFQNLPSQFSNSSAHEFLFQFHQMLTTQNPSEEASTIRAEGMFFPLLLRLMFFVQISIYITAWPHGPWHGDKVWNDLPSFYVCTLYKFFYHCSTCSISQGKSCQYCKRKQIVSTKLVANLSEVERYVNQKKKKKKIHVLAARSEARSFVQRENVCVNCVHVYCCPMHIFLLCCQEEQIIMA